MKSGMPVAGIATGLGVAVISALSFVAARAGPSEALFASDLTVLRFAGAFAPALAALLLVPTLRHTIAALALPKIVLIALAGGAPYALLLYAGFARAPAAHGSAILPGVLLVVSTALGALLAGEHASRRFLAGASLVLAGIAVIGAAAFVSSAAVATGDALFVIAAIMWALYGIMLRRWRIDPLAGTVISILGALPFMPLLLFGASGLWTASLQAIAFQAGIQGALNAFGNVLLYSLTVRLLGPATTALFTALVPILGAALAWATLGEAITHDILIAGALVISGMVVVLRR
jgi:drug/metabolite transporter (DMT)-like permease